MDQLPRPRLGISACLLGQAVRYDSGHKRDPFCVDLLGPLVDWVPVCPEVEVGMPVPRPSLRLTGKSEAPRLIAQKTGEDWTERMASWSAGKVAQLARLELDGWVTKKDSPSCGLTRVRVYGPKAGPATRDGVGAFVAVLRARLPLLPVEEEGRLHDPILRESFVERIFAHARWRRLVGQGLTRGGLVAFHTAQKLAVLAHSPEGYRKLGKLVAGVKGKPLAELGETYAGLLLASLAVPATRGRHVNVLQHVAGYFKEAPREERRELEEVIADFGRGYVPLVVPLTLLRSAARRHGVDYLLGQAYLDPDPRELMLRNHA
jgi:uncharacterized protein YbgA (DUF1722 family)/uncharacterized protein YbbK (DUF523 family)